MRKMQSHTRYPVTIVVFVAIGFVATLSTARGFSSAFDYYANQQFGDFLHIGSPFAALLLIFVVAALIAIVRSPQNVGIFSSKRTFTLTEEAPDSTGRPWRKFDFMLMYVILFVLLVGVLSTWRSGFTTPLLLLTLICYLAMIAVVIETTARFRDKDIRNTCYWIKFFKVFPLNEPIGLILGLLAIANLILIVILANASLIINQYLTAYSVFQIFATFTLIAFTYFGQLLLELASQYERANEDRIRSERFKVELITNVSHDIRTPLTSIISYVDLLKGLPNEDEEFRDYVDVLDRKSMRLKVLIDDLMEASKASTGNLAVSFEYVDLVELVGQIAGEFDDRFTELNLVLVTDDSEQPRMIKADSKHVWRILENLFGNVVKYALPGTRVFAEITIEHDQTAFYDNVVLSIKNTSRLPLEQKGDELMQQFIRGDRARQTEGSGLGLYIAKNLSELMGGSLEIRISGDLFETLVRFKRKP